MRIESGSRRALVGFVGLVLLLATVAGCRGPLARWAEAADPVPLTGGGSGAGTAGARDEGWAEIDRLIGDQKYEAAAAAAAALRERARAAGDEAEWTRALVREAQLRTALHGYAKAVRLLREEPWPESPLERTILRLFYAQGLVQYARAYSWEIGQRERVDAADQDLERWTRERILDEAHRAYSEAWQERAKWGDERPAVLDEYVERHTYPAAVRGTLRDAIGYLWVELLADSSFWSPEQTNGLHRLDLEALLGAGSGGPGPDPDAGHPLERLVAVLGDLEAWHRRGGRPEAALEARLERVRRLHQALGGGEDGRRIREHLAERLAATDRRLPWWSMGQAELAELVRAEAAPDRLVRAREIALAGRSAHPESAGGRRCAYIVASIEAPSFSLESMRSDGRDRRSVRITHSNLERLFFRAYRLDVRATVEGARDYNLLPGYREVDEIVARRQPTAEWTVELPATPDFESHVAWVAPPVTAPGLYVLVASARQDFADEGNRREAVNLIVSDLVLLTRRDPSGFEVTVAAGASGEGVEGARVDLYQVDWRRGHRRIRSQVTGAGGVARLTVERRNEGYFLLAERGEDATLEAGYLWSSHRQRERERTAALVYTDRSVYRPLQEVLWKVVAYRGDGREGSFRTLPGRSLAMELVDANGEVVERAETRSNAFGSASGSFRLPAGRLLGRWTLRCDLGGAVSIAVEEYKRPTFEVEIREPEEALRLNRPARLRGAAEYYFGLPVAVGRAAWTVVREPVYSPWLHGWWWRPPPVPSEVVAAGVSALDADGGFTVEFLPEADERLAGDAGVSYRYRLSVDVTDEGGETRSASRSFRLGFVTVETSIGSDRGFVVAGEAAELSLRRADLDGAPRAGAGSWRLVALRQPEAALLPADRPAPPAEEGRFLTPGDLLRPRWEPAPRVEEILADWADGEEIRRGEVEHGADGLAPLVLEDLDPGAYRLHYTTRDPYGAEFAGRRELLVVAEGATPLALPAALIVERESVPVGEAIRLLVHSALPGQRMVLEVFHGGQRRSRRVLEAAGGPRIVEIPVGADLRGGVGVRLTALRDHQLMSSVESVLVPWDDRRLQVEFESFRDLLRPGAVETWRVRVSAADAGTLAAGAAEVLAYMYDRSLDLFAPHEPVDPLNFYPQRTGVAEMWVSLGGAGSVWTRGRDLVELPDLPALRADRLSFFDGYPIGGMGRRTRGMDRLLVDRAEAPALAEEISVGKPKAVPIPDPEPAGQGGPPEIDEAPSEPLRQDFSETAFWEPHLVLGADGSVAFEFRVPDSVTEWSVWVHALTRDFRAGSLERQAKSVKDLMVRPYLPRFLREGDRARLQVVVQNAGEVELSGTLDLDILDPETEESLLAEFGLGEDEARGVPFAVGPGGSAALVFPIRAPARVGTVAFRVAGRAGDLSDGELRPLPLLPGRMHLAQSRFATLRDRDRRELRFADLAAADDPTRIDERLVVTLDAQLFYSVLSALPYLVEYPYECTEQILNRFLSTGIVSSVFDRYPAVAKMARTLAERDTRLETWEAADPNRKMLLEETPWLVESRGGPEPDERLIKVLDPRVARAQRRASLAKLEKAQTSIGGFPWWPGGPPSPYMTLYLLYGFSKALEFEVEVPREMVERAWAYMHRHYLDEMVRWMEKEDCCWEMVTFLNWVLAAYPDETWTGGVFDAAERRRLLEFSFKHWRRHSPLLKGYLALALARGGRAEDARLVFDSVMDSARTTPDEGTFWAPEERAWLWYNDTIESHAFALRTLTELGPDDERRHGLVQWLLLNKKLSHWKSTRATAEVIYALVHYLEREGTLAAREEARVAIGPLERTFVWEPEVYTGARNRVVVPGEEIDPATMSTVVVEKETPGFLFASATWHFSTERLPEEARGDFFSVERRYFKRLQKGGEWVLERLEDGAALAPGDQLEVQLSLRTRHAAEYVHLRDPRGAGFEPESTASRYRWDLGIGWYEEVRDSGTNFFFDWLPVGEYTFKYRLRAATAGTFRVGPATLQSMYAPEFTAYSSGALLTIHDAGPGR